MDNDYNYRKMTKLQITLFNYRSSSYELVLMQIWLATCLELHVVSWVCWVCKYCNWTCNWYSTIPCKQLHAFSSALQITSVVVKWNYNHWKLSVACGREWDYFVCCWTDGPQFPETPPTYATGSNFESQNVHLWEVVQIFQRESIFCSEISSGGSLIIEIGGSIFTMTGTQTQMLLPKLHSYA